MKVFQTENINWGYDKLMDAIGDTGVHYKSRNGDVLAFNTPITLVTQEPWNRVLFDPVRDANPFFHLFEGLWMLAGRQDLKFVEQYIPGMSEYSDDGVILNGAYGARWRSYFEKDQLEIVIQKLIADPNDRRVVISMWDAYKDLESNSKDIPCNIVILPRIITSPAYIHDELEITIINRSNDIIWGMTGANAVHMSMLQEYLAARLGVQMGNMYQVSTNAHVYLGVFDKYQERCFNDHYFTEDRRIPGDKAWPLVDHPNEFDMDVINWCNHPSESSKDDYFNTFFNYVATPMYQAWAAWKAKDFATALKRANTVYADDWRRAAVAWINRRYKKG